MRSIFAKAVGISAITAALSVIMPPAIWAADNLPPYMNALASRAASTPGEIADRDILQLNTSHVRALRRRRQDLPGTNILAKHPVILALFSGAGGRMILYRPGKPPLEAPSVPIGLPVDEVGRPQHHGDVRGRHALSRQRRPTSAGAAPMLAYRSQMKTALDGLDADGHPGRLAGQQPQHPAEQHRLHGRLPGQGRDHVRRAAGLRQEAGRHF